MLELNLGNLSGQCTLERSDWHFCSDLERENRFSNLAAIDPGLCSIEDYFLSSASLTLKRWLPPLVFSFCWLSNWELYSSFCKFGLLKDFDVVSV